MNEGWSTEDLFLVCDKESFSELLFLVDTSLARTLRRTTRSKHQNLLNTTREKTGRLLEEWPSKKKKNLCRSYLKPLNATKTVYWECTKVFCNYWIAAIDLLTSCLCVDGWRERKRDCMCGYLCNFVCVYAWARVCMSACTLARTVCVHVPCARIQNREKGKKQGLMSGIYSKEKYLEAFCFNLL